jgi:hypothetical protein
MSSELRIEIPPRRSDINALGLVRPGSYHTFLGESGTVVLDRALDGAAGD